MGLFSQFADVVEWQETRDDVIFWKWNEDEIKKGSRLVIRPGQDAIFLYNGRVEGVFTDEGSFDIASDIIPFLSSLKGFKFGFNSGIRAEVLFINTKEFTVKWGTKNAVSIPAPGLPGGMPIRAFGSFHFKVSDYDRLIAKIAGVKKQFCVDDVKERVMAHSDQLLMKWIVREGKDMFHLQAYADEIGRGIAQDLDMEMMKIGISITGFQIQSVSYPEEVARMQQKAASQAMVGDMAKYTQTAMADSMTAGNGSHMAADMAGMQMGMMMGQQMASQYGQMAAAASASSSAQSLGQQTSGTAPGQTIPNFCPNCGAKTTGGKFCSNCGQKLV